MANSNSVRSKLDLDDERTIVAVDEIVSAVSEIFENYGCNPEISRCHGKPGGRFRPCRKP